ncbi:MAG: alginate lyase family protein [Myxococcota bacterium]
MRWSLAIARLRRTHVGEWPARVRGLARRFLDRVQMPVPPRPGPLAPLPLPTIPKADVTFDVPSPCPLARMRANPDRPACEGPEAGSAHDVDVLDLPFDPRVRWEAARLQDLAWWAAQGAPWASDEALTFVARHPVGQGLHWTSALEVALRLISLAVLAHHQPSDALARTIAAHAAYVARHPSVGTSARNHRVGELVGLAVAATVLPDCQDAPAWMAEAETLGAVLRDQLHADGLGVEQSTHYLCFILELGWIAWHCDVPSLAGPLGRGLRALRCLQDATGEALALGDADGGRAWPHSPFDPTPYADQVVQRLTSVLGPSPAPKGHHRFPRAGLTVLRDQGCVVAFDHGPVGEPHLGGHGHDDQLALWLHLTDGPAIGGRGTGSYHDHAVRAFHRSAWAHATLTALNRTPSLPHAHPFLWRRRAQARLEQVDLEAGRVLASHDGYAEQGLRLAREVRLVSVTLLIDDQVHGHGPVELTWMWPLHPRLSARIEGLGIVVHDGERDRLTIDPPPGFTIELLREGNRPGPGWHATGYGRWVPATTLRISGSTMAPGRFLTRIGVLDPRHRW